MSANMRCEKNSLALLSSKRTKAFSKSRADEAFALPLFSDAAPSFAADSSYRSGREQRVEHHVNDVERLKQTMLRHESMFKEQLHELHRLYQVQRLLMEESKRKSLASHPHSDSPSSNSSLLYNPELSKVKEERRFWEASDASKQLSFFLGQIDVNKPCEDKHYTDRLVDAMPSHKDTQRRPIIDLERPAEEHVEAEGEDEKPLMRASLFQQVGNPKFPCANWWDSQCSSVSGRSANITMHEEKSTNKCIEFPSNSKWRSFEDCFTPSRQKEAPFFLSGSFDSKKHLVEEANLPSSPATSLFGVNLRQALKSRDVQAPGMHSNLDHSRREVQIAGSDACDKSTGQMSKLPHWLLQGLQTTSATKVSRISSSHVMQHQTSPFSLQKQGERMSCFDERVPSFSAQQECSDSWLRSGGGSPLVLRAPQCKPSSGYFFAATTGNAQGFHKLAEASNSANDGSAFMSPPPSIERRLGISSTSATSHASSPFITKQSSRSDSEAVSPSLLKELGLNMKSGGSPMPPPWYPQRAPSTFMPQFSKAGAEPSNAFLLNSSSSWVSVPTQEQVQEGVFTKSTPHTGEGNIRGPACFSPSVATRPDVSSKRLIFGFLPTASDLDLTLGLDLNDNESMERVQRVDDGDSVLNEQSRKHDKVGLQSEPFSNDFDLNEQSGDAMDAESQAIPTGFKHKCEGWGMPSGLKAPYFEEWQTSHNSSSLKRIPEETTASTTSVRQESVNSFLHDRHRDAQDHEQLHDTGINGRSLVGGRSSDGSGLTSCKSRSTPIPTYLKSRGDSALSGEACQSMLMKHPSQEALFDEASMVMVGRKQELFSALLGSLEVCQAEGLPIEKHTSKDDDYAAAGVSEGNVEVFEAADSLLRMSLDMPSVVVEDPNADGDEERALKWLADMIPQDDVYGIDDGEKTLDAFELSVLSLTPISSTSETICAQPVERRDVAEECLPPSNLRRRSLRRGRAGKDFQKEMLPSIASLSRQEITEDLQIIEGLVKSATEAMARCSLSSKEDVSWSLPALSSAKTPSKAKGLRTCKGGKQSGLLRVCSWGEATRRRRMRRQRRVCMPLGV